MLPIRMAELVDAEGDFDLILAGLKSECILPSWSGEPVGQDLIAKDAGGSVAPNPEGMIGVRLRVRRMSLRSRVRILFFTFLFRPSMAVFLSWDWPVVVLNPRRFRDF